MQSVCAVLAQGVWCMWRESTKQLSTLGACTRTRGAHTCLPTVAQPPCAEQDMHWHTSFPKSTTCIRQSKQGAPSCSPAPQLQCPLNVGWKPWPKHWPFATVGFSVKIPWFWGTQHSPPAFMGNRFRMKSREWLAKRARPWGTRGGCQGTPECSGCTTNQ